MDRTDYQILNLLQADSRTTLKTIGDSVGLTAPAVSERGPCGPYAAGQQPDRLYPGGGLS